MAVDTKCSTFSGALFRAISSFCLNLLNTMDRRKPFNLYGGSTKDQDWRHIVLGSQIFGPVSMEGSECPALLQTPNLFAR